jgi:hypothetical protein
MKPLANSHMDWRYKYSGMLPIAHPRLIWHCSQVPWYHAHWLGWTRALFAIHKAVILYRVDANVVCVCVCVRGAVHIVCCNICCIFPGFPDPFQDDSGGESCPPLPQGLPSVPPSYLNLPTVSSKQGAHKLESVSQCITTVTPSSSPTLAAPRGHRRNMSDTSAFNKYAYGSYFK